MNIQVHIDRLILDGLPVHWNQGALVQAAVEKELTRVLGERGVGGISSAALAFRSAPEIMLAPHNTPIALGQQIAHAVYGSFTTPDEGGRK